MEVKKTKDVSTKKQKPQSTEMKSGKSTERRTSTKKRKAKANADTSQDAATARAVSERRPKGAKTSKSRLSVADGKTSERVRSEVKKRAISREKATAPSKEKEKSLIPSKDKDSAPMKESDKEHDKKEPEKESEKKEAPPDVGVKTGEEISSVKSKVSTRRERSTKSREGTSVSGRKKDRMHKAKAMFMNFSKEVRPKKHDAVEKAAEKTDKVGEQTEFEPIAGVVHPAKSKDKEFQLKWKVPEGPAVPADSDPNPNHSKTAMEILADPSSPATTPVGTSPTTNSGASGTVKSSDSAPKTAAPIMCAPVTLAGTPPVIAIVAGVTPTTPEGPKGSKQ